MIRGVIVSSNGAISNAVMFVSFIYMLSDGPATSFNGSPTVSPTTAAVCVGVPFIQNPCASMLFLALSQRPPPYVKNDASKAAVHVAPSNHNYRCGNCNERRQNHLFQRIFGADIYTPIVIGLGFSL